VALVGTVSSAEFICCCWRNPWCDCHVTHTPKCNDQTKIRANYLKKYSSLFSLCRSRITTELRSGTVDKMANIFTKFIWQPYSQSIHLYTVWKFFEPSIVGAS